MTPNRILNPHLILVWNGTLFFTVKLDNSTGEMVYSLGISDLENVNPPDLTKLPYSSVKKSQISGNIYIFEIVQFFMI